MPGPACMGTTFFIDSKERLMAIRMMHHDEDSSMEIHPGLVGGLVGAGSLSLLGRGGPTGALMAAFRPQDAGRGK